MSFPVEHRLTILAGLERPSKAADKVTRYWSSELSIHSLSLLTTLQTTRSKPGEL